MGDLLVRFAGREHVRELLGQLEGKAGESLVQELVEELERLTARRRDELQPVSPAGGERSTASPEDPLPPVSETPAYQDGPPAEETVGFAMNPLVEGEEEAPPDFFVREVPPGEQAEQSVGSATGEPWSVHPFPREPEGEAVLVPLPEPVSEAGVPSPEIPAAVPEIPLPLTRNNLVKIPVELDDNDWIYLHGVASIPFEERPSPKAFMLEEKGITGKDFAFALDRGGLRFCLSRIGARSLNVSKTGILLLNKQDSIRLRGVHASILVDLRAHGVILPFDFGTVALGIDDLHSKIDERLFDISDAMEDLLATTWWKLEVFMLDARLAQVVGGERTTVRRERERQSFQPVLHQQKMDIKTTERVLGKQKKIAEVIHEEVSQLAERSKVEMMVNFSSGTADDWKPILRASYDVRPDRVPKLNRLLTEIQYRHFLFELMLVLTGDREPFSFLTK